MAASDSSPESNENHRQYKFGDHQDDEGRMRRTGEEISKAPTNAAGEKHRRTAAEGYAIESRPTRQV
jgi:hypothetical protein